MSLLEIQGDKMRISFLQKMMPTHIKSNFIGKNSFHQFSMESKKESSILKA
jgi:hypothetical protein